MLVKILPVIISVVNILMNQIILKQHKIIIFFHMGINTYLHSKKFKILEKNKFAI